MIAFSFILRTFEKYHAYIVQLHVVFVYNDGMTDIPRKQKKKNKNKNVFAKTKYKNVFEERYGY